MLTIPRTSLRIEPGRQRGSVTPDAIAALADSIEANSLFHPPVVQALPDGSFELLAGETRVRAIDFLQADGKSIRCGSAVIAPGHIPVTPLSELSELQAFTIELEENIRRTPLPWLREVEATAKLHRLRLASGASQREALRETAATMTALQGRKEAIEPHEVHKAILLDKYKDDPDIARAKSMADAVKVLTRKVRKEEDATAAAVSEDLTSFVNEDCIDVLRRLPDASFDAVISDPPYGIGITQLSYQNASEQEYDDSEERWLDLMAALWEELPRVLKPNAAGFIFCDWSRFETLAAAARGAGFEVYPRPFIWDRSPDGRLTTPEKWPRRCYECILHFRRGDRAVMEVRSDVLRYPADRATENYHGAKKPVALFVDLAERVLRPGDAVLDPFAGSGPLSRAAKKLNLRHLSIERDPAYYGLMLRLYGEKKEQEALL